MNKKGFTLVELLVVMVIIATLSAIIFPIMSSVREKTEQNTCMQNLKQIGLAVDMFHADNKKYPDGLAPDVQYDGSKVVPMNEATGNLLQSDYIQNYTVFHCPMDDRFEDVNEVCTLKYTNSSKGITIDKELYAYSSYEKYINDETIKTGNKYTDPTTIPTFSKEWWKLAKGKTSDDGDYARQLKWKNPPANTVICWCSNHCDYPYSGNQTDYPTRGNSLVLFLDGHVDVYTDSKQISSAKWTIEPNHYNL